MRRSASIATPDLTGILNVNKARGWTSHDVVARVRRLANQKRVGHAGTLDPLAEGVLPVLLGRATRLTEFIQSGQKVYEAAVQLGAATTTDDAEGDVSTTAPVPVLSRTLLEAALAPFRGDILQTPPRYSALKVGGRRAYALARSGGDVELSPRPVTIHELRLINFADSVLRIEVTCSKGTYIRALARDVAERLGTVGHLAALLRTRVGPFSLADSHTLDELTASGLQGSVLSPARVLPEAPSYTASEETAPRFANGQPIAVAGLRAEHVWVYDPVGQLIGLGVAVGLHLRSRLAL